LTITIDEEVKVPFSFDYNELTERVIIGALDFIECPYEAEVNVLFTDNASIQEINRENREIDAPTDVLSFPIGEYPVPGVFDTLEDEQPEVFHPETGELMLGDIVISLERAAEQAKEIGNSFEREVAFLVIHSTLHLLGYDHERSADDEEAQCLAQREIIESLQF
jgi:probable rRNA maturation factor